MKTMNVKLTGLRPLVMHNGLLADPTNQYTVAMKNITAKGSKKLTLSDYKERDHLEWMGSVYWSEQDKYLFLPSDNIEACVIEGARKQRKGKDALAVVFCQEAEVELKHPKSGKSLKEIEADPNYTLRKGVKINNKARIIRIRPRISDWSASFTLEFDDSILNASDLKTALVDAGALVGIGDWRPKYGRFLVEF
jgi:hypothetical protein